MVREHVPPHVVVMVIENEVYAEVMMIMMLVGDGLE